jgi:phage shock protein A
MSEPIDAEIVPDAPAPAPVPAPAPAAPDYDEHGVPSFDHVRDKIESRYATSIGATELAAETTEGRTVEQQEAERAKAAAAKLEEIRRSLRSP